MKRYAFLFLTSILALSTALVAKPKKGQATAANKDTPTPSSDLPANLNLVSMRVHAIDVIYQLDLSKEQIKSLSDLAEGTKDEHARKTAVGNPALVTAFEDFYHAQLTGKQDEDLAKMRNSLAELVTDDAVQLDDEVRPTPKAWAKVGTFTKQLTVGQIAAYLAFHADEIADPAEKMVGLLTELHDTTNATEIENQTKETTQAIAREVAGNDDAKVAQIAEAVSAWVKEHKNISVDDLMTTHDALETSAKKVIGDAPPMDLLGHWVDGELAELLSNPQLPEAINAVSAHPEQLK